MINRRISWLNTIQGLLFASLAWLQTPEYETTGKLNAITYVLAAVGIVTAVNTLRMTYLAIKAVKALLKVWKEYANVVSYVHDWKYFEPVVGFWTDVTDLEDPTQWTLDKGDTQRLRDMPWHPLVFMASWVAIIIITVCYK